MEERRKSPRRRVLKGGTIALERGGAVSCTVRNLSESGACIEVGSPLGIPESFNLVIASDHVTRPCRIMWRSDRRIGVAFGRGCEPYQLLSE
jgi:hypothetical protein